MLSPFTDEKEIIRVGGRADKAIVTYDSKHPVLLPKNHHISYLITKETHDTNHTGVATTTALTRRKFWIIGVQKLAKSIKKKCIYCKKLHPQIQSQFMAELPQIRLNCLTHHRSTTQLVTILDRIKSKLDEIKLRNTMVYCLLV